MKIYVVTHKKFNPPKIMGYIPIQVGKINTNEKLGYISDDTGINIAEKNSTYCELTALYWMWKNDVSNENIGLCHYRRYFTTNPFSTLEKYYISEKFVDEHLKKVDIILPQKVYLKTSVAEKYSLTNAGFQKDLDTVRDVIQKEFPEYLSSYDKVMNGNQQYFWNMFITRHKLMNDYCEWLFSIMSKVENLTNLEGYSVRQKRIFGYISERLLNVWVEKNKLSIYECPVVQSDQGEIATIKSNIGIMLKKKRM